MTTSMTAFARAETTLDGIQLTWEVRSVNHRYLDISIKLPEEFRGLEDDCRRKFTKSLGRGRVDAHLKVEKISKTVALSAIDTDAVEALVDVINQIERAHPGLQPARSTDILRWPGVIIENFGLVTNTGETILDTLDAGISQLVDNRVREGQKLGQLVMERVDRSKKIISRLNGNMKEIQNKSREKLQKRIERISTEIDNERIAQEIALILTKNDVSEELDRLVTHLDEVTALLSSSEPVGRRLDFLMQELNREANTLGAKSIDQVMTDASIDLKVLVDQMREQIQNIE